MKIKNLFSNIVKLYSEHKKIAIPLTALVLVLAITFGCVMPIFVWNNKDKGDDDGDTGGTIIGGGGNGDTEYTVKVVTVGGMALEGVVVYVYNGEGNMCTMPQETDENGITKFTLKTSDDYTVHIDGVPEGYNVRSGETAEERYALTAPDTVITVSSAPITTGGFKDSYELGDVMYDFTLTDVNGEDYTLSELLKTKDMVMLNFWYVECPNCLYEFPYINTVYNDYKDDIEIIAINDYAADTEADVEVYPDYFEDTFNIPLFKVGNTEDDLTLSRFPSEGYPTTVIIDRYGVICMIEVGAVLGESKWKNVFDHFVGEGYKQTLITDPSILNPMIKPTVQWTDSSASEIADAFNSGDINVTYRPETSGKDAEYAWPFVAGTHQGENVIYPSNTGVDNSFAILYADVQLKPGQAIMFDYFSSTQKDEMGADVLYALVNGKDIYSIAGVSDEYATCCTFVDPRPIVAGVNENDVATYEVAFAFYKDTVDAAGDDTVYLKNLRVVSVEDIDVETYIFRYAATDLNETEDGYNTYVEVFYNENDGYYHVGKVDGPLLLANHLGYTLFDSEKTVSERVYANYELYVDDVNMFNNWLIYGNAAANSQIAYCTPVTEELRTMLIAYCEEYYFELGKSYSENLWLQLCVYYDAYGEDKDGNPTKQLADPIRGLTAFSAYDMEIIATPDTTVSEEVVVSTAEVEYNMVIMPRGYLYKFVPEVSGVYRVTSKSEAEVNGWIFVESDKWADNFGDRTVLTSYEVAERWCNELIITDKDGNASFDRTNVSMVAYMEAGEEYYIDIAYYDLYEVGSFTFEVKWIGESFNHFIQASPGPITYIESMDGSIGKLIAAGIDYTFVEEDGVEYAYYVKGYDEDGNAILGDKIYADFFYPTTLFPSQSIEALINANAFNYTITSKDREALIVLDQLKLDGKSAFIKEIVDALMVNAEATARADAEAKWISLDMDAVIADKNDNGVFDGEYTDEVKKFAETVIGKGLVEGKEYLIDYWADEFYAEAKSQANADAEAEWNAYGTGNVDMDDVFRYAFAHASVNGEYAITFDFTGSSYAQDAIDLVNEAIATGMAELKEEWGTSFATNWVDYQLTDIINNCLKTGQFHNTDNRTNKDIKAQKYLDTYTKDGKAALQALWDAEFSTITPPEDENVTNVSDWRFNYLWDYYEMDDVSEGTFHGNLVNYTDTIRAYIAQMDNGATNPERQGCVAVTKELANILNTLIAREIFEDVENGWLKFCFYYDTLGQ